MVKIVPPVGASTDHPPIWQLGLVNLPDLQAINVLVESGQVGPIVDRTYSLPEAADAVRTLQSGRAHRTQVITI
jgi:hypothetical protein